MTIAPPPLRRSTSWHWSLRFGFLAFFVFALLFVLPFPFGLFGFPLPFASFWAKLSEPLVPWVARNVLRRYDSFGADTRYFIQTGCFAAISVLTAAAWSVAQRHRPHYQDLDAGLRVYLRLFLAAVLFAYGWTKVIPTQFPPLGPDRLSEAFGEASPNGFLWAFMGYSPAYAAFGGLGELTAGVLLCFRRTATLGALIGIAVMSNVVALNFAYDVPVKLDSSFYLLALAYIAAADARRLANVLLLNRTAAPAPIPRTRSSARQHVLTVVAPGIIALYAFVHPARDSWTALHKWGRLAPHPPLYGLYDVEHVTRNGVSYPTAPRDTAVMMRLAIGQFRSTVRFASGALGFYIASVDTSARTLRLKPRDVDGRALEFTYETPDTATLTLRGNVDAQPLELALRRRDVTAYRIVSHPFHWTHDTNENR